MPFLVLLLSLAVALIQMWSCVVCDCLVRLQDVHYVQSRMVCLAQEMAWSRGAWRKD